MLNEMIKMNNRLLAVLVWATLSTAVYAQSGTNSPYSQYGLGQLADQASGFNRGMNGLGVGMRGSYQVNFLNPASYSSIDSLTLLFDAGISGQLTNFNENGKKKNAKNANFEYVTAAFRAFKHVGVSVGLLPFSNIGYNYSSTNFVDEEKKTTYTNTYAGSGGLHLVYLGMGWEPFKGFSIGGNIAYLWGQYSRTIINTYSDNTINTLSKIYAAEVRSYKLDLGAQYELPLGKNDRVTLGFTYGLGHKLSADPSCVVTSTNPQTSVSNSANHVVRNGLELPTMMAGGFVWNHKNKVKIGADYSLQQWSKVGFPDYVTTGDEGQYTLNKNYFKDRHKMTVGGEYCKNEAGTRFAHRIRYRVGASYTTPYLRINGQDGPKEISVSAGFGIPIINGWSDRKMFNISNLNISGQWVQQSANAFIKENTFRINIGITFNEGWFAKWKVN